MLHLYIPQGPMSIYTFSHTKSTRFLHRHYWRNNRRESDNRKIWNLSDIPTEQLRQRLIPAGKNMTQHCFFWYDGATFLLSKRDTFICILSAIRSNIKGYLHHICFTTDFVYWKVCKVSHILFYFLHLCVNWNFLSLSSNLVVNGFHQRTTTPASWKRSFAIIFRLFQCQNEKK